MSWLLLATRRQQLPCVEVPKIPIAFDPWIAAAGLLVGLVVGLTGMGGGALMTPILILLFRVPPLAAIGSDLVASLFMKPVGTAVHWRRGTVDKSLVAWLLLGSVPAAFSGVFLVRLAGHGAQLQARVQMLLGLALMLAVAGLVVRVCLRPHDRDDAPIRARPVPTLLVGVAGGLIVGMTSVGSGSLVIVLLMALYPPLSSSRLVGTDLAQAVPMVGAAALGHAIFGDFRPSLSVSIVAGAIPGVYIGARLSAGSSDVVIRPLLIFVLFASAVKLLGFSPTQFGPLVIAGTLAALVAYFTWARRRTVALAPAREAA